MRKTINNRTFWIFLLCAELLILTQVLILKPILDYTLFTENDWIFLLESRALPDLNFFEKLLFIWTKIGIHEGAYASYMAFLGKLFENNYSNYQYFNVFLKIISTLTIFPVILLLFKNRLLAFLTTLIYGINSASAGSFYWYMKGGIFPGIALMNLFFISYYYTLIKNSRGWLIISAILILLTYLTSPTRIFPIFLIVLAVEIYKMAKNKTKNLLKKSILRIIVLLLPAIFVSVAAPVSPRGRVESTPFTLFQQIIEGNWFNLLSPIEGIGYSLLTNENMNFLGRINVSTFLSLNNYLGLLFNSGFWVFLSAFILVAFIASKKPFKFILTALLINFALDILMFFVAGHHFFIAENKVQKMDPMLFFSTKYPTLIGIFILSTAFTAFLEWLKHKKDNYLSALFIGPLFSLLFLTSMWITIGYLLDGYNSLHYYYQIPAIGISLFLAAILCMLYKKFNSKYLRLLGIALLAQILITFYSSNKYAIDKEFMGINEEKIKLADQNKLHDNLINKVKNYDQDKVLIFLEFPQDKKESQYYKRALLLDNSMLGVIFYWFNTKDQPRCIGDINDIKKLKSAKNIKDGDTGFILSGRCVNTSKINFLAKNTPLKTYTTEDKVFYSLNSIYAFRIENGDFIDIKQQVLKEFQ